jgi:phosphoglycerol transferase
MINNIFTVLSILLLIAGLFIFTKAKSLKITTGVFFMMVLTSVILFIAHGVADYFTGNGIDEATIYHLKYGLSDAGFLEYSWLILTTVIALILAVYFSFQAILKRNNDKEAHPSNSLLSFSFVSISLLLNPASIDIFTLKANSLISEDNLNSRIPSYFYEYYRLPSIRESQNEHKNIVYIYAESLERTYFDTALFPGLINGIRKLEAKNSISFTNIKQVDGTGWTIAGITASQCGIPLFTPSHGNSMSGMDQFLSSAVCLGDLLNEEGYQLNYIGGASLNFAGKEKFFKTHGFSNLWGRDELLPKLKNKAYTTGWGLYDDSLLTMAYNRFIELSETGDKFGLFTLTLDTHHPKGHSSKSCKGTEYKDASNPILNAAACSDYLISNFINKITNSPYADKTIIVLTSDHLSMRNTAYDLLQKGDRRNLFMIIDPRNNKAKEIKTVGSTLDIAPTLLSFLGYKGSIGLGRDLLNNEESEKDRLFIHSNLKKWRQQISEFWDFPKIQGNLNIDINNQVVSIEKRNFKIPILIELNENLQSTLKFEFDKSRGHKSLVEYRKKLGKNDYFLLIDKCKNLLELDSSLGEKGFCFLAGQGKRYTKRLKLNNNITWTASDLMAMLGVSNGFIAHRVAHAGGGINNKTYTNSFEALDFNIKKGFQYFEIDFSFTKDGNLVCLHDWEHSFKRSFGFSTDEKVTLEDFNRLVKDNSAFHNCTINSLSEWMEMNPSAIIVTDVKENNIEALKTILKTLPNPELRVIPQIYNPENFNKVRTMGFEKIIWTLYRYRKSNSKVLDWVKKFPAPFAITMPKSRAESTLPKELEKRRIPSYVHTINTVQEENLYINILGITEIYTDFLNP